ncbi:Holliday junction branch migration DNA helicase RuvB [Candidatus Falkowbacteria bacterium]|nr:Holliday junction branch migration DNA helicase RuvB [Candidatus Falkowbacteria bacterium]NCT54440.1 Holliday junction branch migration DNA helicase RuvB [Candidatus Falkowbacteria bacterium]
MNKKIQKSESEKNEERLISPIESPSDDKLELTLRPKVLTEYIGQEKIKKNLAITIKAAKNRGENIEHVLFYGAPGLGKTTLAHVIANETGANIRVTSGPAIEKGGDLAAILSNLEEGDILFIDEIHRLRKAVEEILYPAMEDGAIDIIMGKGPTARTLRLDLPGFTIIGATTLASLLSAPLRDRFGIIHHLNFYQIEDIEKIVLRSAGILGVKIEKSAALEIAKRSRRTPRVANRLLKRVRDYCQVEGDGKVSLDICLEAFKVLEVDELGLDYIDRELMEIIAKKFKGGPVGLNTLAAASGEELETIENVYEPYLMQLGFLDRSARGRVLTELGFKHLGLKP